MEEAERPAEQPRRYQGAAVGGHRAGQGERSMKTVMDILRDYLEENGYDGLENNKGCVCFLNKESDFFDCDGYCDIAKCTPWRDDEEEN
jgi:hypothetical protein